MPRQALLPRRILVGRARLHPHIRRDPPLLDAPPRGRVVARDGQLEPRPVLQLDHRLHASLAERLRPHHYRPAVVLQRARDDLARARGAAVDQHDHRVAGLGVLRVRPLHLDVFGAAPFGRDDHAVVEEAIGHLDGLLEQPARVVAQVQHDSGQRPARLRPQRIEPLLQIDVGAVLEVLDLHVPVSVVVELRLDRHDADDVAHQRHGTRLAPGRARHLEQASGARRAHQRLDAIDLLPAARLRAVDLQQLVAGRKSRAGRRRLVERRHNHQLVAARRDLQADAAVLAVGLLLQRGVRLRLHEGGVGIERPDHALDGAVEELRVVDVLDVVVLDEAQHVAEHVELAVRPGRIGGGARHAHEPQHRERRACAQNREATCSGPRGRLDRGRHHLHRHPSRIVSVTVKC